MRITVHGRNIEVSDALREYVQFRLSFALGRFESRVARATVRLTDVNGPRGGVDKRCRILVALGSAGSLATEDTDPNLHTAIDRAAGAAGVAVARALERRREQARGPRRVPS